MWEDAEGMENAFLGVGGASSILSVTKSSTLPRGTVKSVPQRGTGNTWLQTQGTIKSTRFGRAGPQPCCPSPPSPSYLLLSLLSSFQQAFLFRLTFPSLESLPTLSSLTPPFSFLHLRLLLSFLTFLLRAGFLSLSGSSRFTAPPPPAHFSPPFTPNFSLSPTEENWRLSPQQSNRLEIDAAAWLDGGGRPAATWGQRPGVLMADK